LLLNGLSQQHKIKVIGAFAVAICQGKISRQNDAPLAESTVIDTLNLVAAIFQENGREDPPKDAENNIG
jgi:hypothetical protein